MTIFNQTKNTIIAKQAAMADTFRARLVGLLNRESIDDNEALIITQCQSIHMFFMRFAIDAIFVDKNNSVVGLVNNIQPGHLSPFFPRSSYCIETAVGAIQKSDTSIGDTIKLEI